MENNLTDEQQAMMSAKAKRRSNIYILLAFITVVATGFAALGVLYMKSLPFSQKQTSQQLFPIKVTGASIESADVSWKEVNEASQVSDGVTHHPSITLHLAAGNTQASLNGYFINAKGTPVGDGSILNIKNGNFQNGNRSITIDCSTGFSDIAHYRHYRYVTDETWNFILTQLDSEGKHLPVARIPLPAH